MVSSFSGLWNYGAITECTIMGGCLITSTKAQNLAFY